MCMLAHLSAGCSRKDPERTDVLPDSVLTLVLQESRLPNNKKKKRRPSPRRLSDCDIQQSVFNLLRFYGTVCAVG